MCRAWRSHHPGKKRGTTRATAGQAAIEMIVMLILGTALLGSILIFHKIASEDEELLADSRWIAYQCAFYGERCTSAVEQHSPHLARLNGQVQPDEALTRSRRVWLERVDSGPSVLASRSLGDWSLEDPTAIAGRFGLDVEAGLVGASTGMQRSATPTEASFGLPGTMSFASRRIATLRDTWSQDPFADHDPQTLQVVRDAIEIPAQLAVDPVLTLTEVMQRALAWLGLETYEANWSHRPIRPLRKGLQESGCAGCSALPTAD
jgi:hypothetical protein